MDILAKLFGTAEKVRIMRLFLFNPELVFDIDAVSLRTQVKSGKARIEISTLQKIGLLKGKSFVKEITRKKGKKVITKKVRVSGWILNPAFKYIEQLQSFLVNISPVKGNEILRKVGKIGKLRLVITAGVFIQNWESRLDLLVVCDNLKTGALEKTIRNLEAEMGKEIRYSALETTEFQYRLGLYDKLVRDVLDYPHEVVLDKLGVSSRNTQ
jgi:hypothetical protein